MKVKLLQETWNKGFSARQVLCKTKHKSKSFVKQKGTEVLHKTQDSFVKREGTEVLHKTQDCFVKQEGTKVLNKTQDSFVKQ